MSVSKQNNITRASTIYLELNSLDRDYVKYPNPAEYRMDLQDNIKNVEKLTLIGGTIPVNDYNIQEYNKTFDLSDSTGIHHISLTEGVYTLSQLSTELQSKLNAANPVYTVTSNSNTKKLTIRSSSGGYALIFNSSSIGNGFEAKTVTDNHINTIKKITNAAVLLGFNPLNNAISGTSAPYELTSLYPVHIIRPERLYVYINSSHTSSYSNIKQTRRQKKLYGIIYLKNDEVEILDNETTRFFSQTYGGQDLRYMDMEFRDEYGNLYNFQNKNHTLVFKLDISTPMILPNNGPTFMGPIPPNIDTMRAGMPIY